MASDICRWGILSTAEIGQKNWQAIRLAENATLKAVASRSEQKAQDFIDRCQSHVSFDERPQALGSYEALLESSEIDAIYIPLPTGIRKKWVIEAAKAGKHVLCEKPCAPSLRDLQEMIDSCNASNVQFMDGVMFMHSQRLPKVREVLDSDRLGDLRRLHVQFSFCAPQEFMQGNIRSSSELEPQGCVGDLGWYAIRIMLFAMNYKMPKQVTGRYLNQHQRADSSSPVPTEFFSELFFDDGISASFYVSFVTEHQQFVHVSGTKGHLILSDFVLPFYGNSLRFEVNNPAFNVDICDFNMERHSETFEVYEYSNSWKNAQETNLIRNFSAHAISGNPDSFWPDVALKTQTVLDLCLKSANEGGKLIDV